MQDRRPLTPEQRQEVLAAIVPFKGRSVDPDAEVRVYRNLRDPGGQRWSIQQKQPKGRWLVVGHAARLMMRDVRFTVSKAGVARAKRLGHKVVCAWAAGYLIESGMGARASDGPKMPMRIEFDANLEAFVIPAYRRRIVVQSAWCAALNEHGLTATYTASSWTCNT